ncbi:NAD(P)-dependent dehydrogenase (short-subunit alcohol dehydrogenase family) [Nitrobacteraceae bacterium AZCC 1564]
MSLPKHNRNFMSERRQAGSAIVVTGAAGGIGGGIARRLLADGWRVIATDLNAKNLAELQSQDDSGRLVTMSLDVATPDEVRDVAASLKKDQIAIAGLVNAAGLLQDIKSFMAMDEAAQRRIWDVNYFGTVTCTQVFAASMTSEGGGSIVNITSINELRPLPLHAYAPTKVALGSLTTLTAGEFGPAGIRVNSIAPGFTLTPIMREKIETGKRDVGAIERATAMRRLVEIDEIAGVASFLMSDDASAITGASIPVDAGWLATSHWMNFGELLSS